MICGYERIITIDHTNVGLTNSGTIDSGFPVLISGSGDWLKTTANGGNVTTASGYDIIFIEDDGETLLYHDIEAYDGDAGTLVAWVRLNSLSKSVDTDIIIRYGDEDITLPTEDPDEVWSDFVGVYHLNETASGIVGEFYDSSPADNHATGSDSGNPSQVDGKMDKGQHFDGNDFIDCGDIDDIDGATTLTVSTWFKLDGLLAVDGNNALVGKGNFDFPNFAEFLIWRDEFAGTTGRLNTFSAAVSTDSDTIIFYGSDSTSSGTDWYHVVMTYVGNDTSGLRLYVNGVEDTIGPIDTSTVPALGGSEALPVHIGETSDGAMGAVATFDEVRITTTIRSADWIVTEYNNQGSPATFYEIKEEQPIGCTDNKFIGIRYGSYWMRVPLGSTQSIIGVPW